MYINFNLVISFGYIEYRNGFNYFVMQVLCKKVSDDNLWPMVSHLLEGLADYQAQSSSGACVVLNGIVKARISALLSKVYYLYINFVNESSGQL